MRYNGGGFLDIASELAYMVATPAATRGTVFERLQFNSKNPFARSRRAQATRAVPCDHARLLDARPAQPLPQLGLSRVTVLAGPDTCSASESVVNGLRGVGITVNLIGGAHLRQALWLLPAGQLRHDLFRDPVPGREPAGLRRLWRRLRADLRGGGRLRPCAGRPAEGRLAAALSLRSTGACPAAPQAGAQRARQGAGCGDRPT